MSSSLPRDEWRSREEAHAAAVDALTAGHRRRQRAGQAHPVEDFLFTYYSHRLGHLRRWHPGVGVRLEEAAGLERAGWRHYRVRDDGAVELDLPAYRHARGRGVAFVADLVAATLARPAHHGCFGLHEWAMVHGLGPGQVRHEDLPLRLSPAQTDAVVEAATVRCSHIDAYRFFTPSARERNTLRPTRETQIDLEQPGCLHAGMDLYKWCYTLAPAVPSSLTLAAFELAGRARALDMQASPYDVSALGYPAIAIETPAGRAEYVRRQRALTIESNALRRRLLEVCDALLPEGAPPTDGSRVAADGARVAADGAREAAGQGAREAAGRGAPAAARSARRASRGVEHGQPEVQLEARATVGQVETGDLRDP